MANHQPALGAAGLLGGLALLASLSLALALALGSVPLGPVDLWVALSGHDHTLNQTLVWELRGPRAAAAFAVGGLLALAGLLMQVLLRNPLADPYVLGVSGGAAAGALSALWLGLGGAWLSGSALAGALVSAALVLALGRKGGWIPTRLLLTGIVLAAGWGALISGILALSPDAGLRGMLFWLMGDLGYASHPWGAWALLALGLVIALPLARGLNVLAQGEVQAAALGVAVQPLRLTLYVLASALTAAAVMMAGSIGFVGLVVPHMLRLAAGSDHRLLVPASILLGGSLLTLADTLARTVAAPQQLPVGVVTAALGVPVFLWLLRRSA